MLQQSCLQSYPNKQFNLSQILLQHMTSFQIESKRIISIIRLDSIIKYIDTNATIIDSLIDMSNRYYCI